MKNYVIGRVMNPKKKRIQAVVGWESTNRKGCYKFIVVGTDEYFQKFLEHVTDEVTPIPENIYSTLLRVTEDCNSGAQT